MILLDVPRLFLRFAYSLLQLISCFTSDVKPRPAVAELKKQTKTCFFRVKDDTKVLMGPCENAHEHVTDGTENAPSTW